MSGGRARMAGLSAAYTLFVFTALAALAVLAARRGGRFDLTATGRHSIEPATQAILDSIPPASQPVDIMAVTSALIAAGNAREADAQVRPLLMALADASPLVRTDVRLAESEPALVQELTIDRVPVIIMHWQPPPAAPGEAAPPARQRRTFDITEAGIATALRDLLEDRKRVAVLLTGHDEMRPTDTGPTGFSLAAQILRAMNFDVRELVLAGSADIPDDADLVVLAGPQSDLLKPELQAFERHLARGGSFLILDGPTRDAQALQGLDVWLAGRWNLLPEPGVVADFDVPLGADARILLVAPPEAPDHPVATGLTKVMQIPLARNITFLDQALDGVAVTRLLASGPRSWLETDLSMREPKYDADVDTQGPLAIAWAGTSMPAGQTREARLVLLGSRIAFSNQHLGAGGNIDLLRNAVDWATRREDDIAARRGSATEGGIVVSQRQSNIILAATLLVPAIVALTGAVTWWRRRRM